MPELPGSSALDRRTLLRSLGAVASLLPAAGAAGAGNVEPVGPRGSSPQGTRAERSFQTRLDAARLARHRSAATQTPNGDEDRYPSRFASYSKGLPHDAVGIVDPAAYASLLAALSSGDPADFERIQLGLGRKLTSPQAGLGFDLEGADAQSLAIPPAPRFDSAEEAAEIAENYWMAVLRDVSFTEYVDDPAVGDACSDLSRFGAFAGPKEHGTVTPGTLFRGLTPGDVVGPWLSQFLILDVPLGALRVPQLMNTVVPSHDYMTHYDDWLAVQRGDDRGGQDVFDTTPRYIRNLRDMAQWVHVDALYQAYLHACLILLGMGAPLGPELPSSSTQAGFVDFGGPHILTLMTEIATRALKAVWYQKWFVHRRLRPETFAGRVHNHATGAAAYPVHSDILNSAVLPLLHTRNGSYLLPMAFPEGSPTHPAYGAGHATVAGACVTMLKAFFDETFVLPNPMVPTPNGTSLAPYRGHDLTVGNELNKVAANVAIGRNGAGVHWRSDYTSSVHLGERVAITVLQEQKSCFNQDFRWTFTSFDGDRIVI